VFAVIVQSFVVTSHVYLLTVVHSLDLSKVYLTYRCVVNFKLFSFVEVELITTQ